MTINPEHLAALEKLAQFGQFGQSSQFSQSNWSPTVGYDSRPPTVPQVLNAINMARVQEIGTPQERRDAFGRIINSGLVSTSPAQNALRMIGGGILGRAITGAFTNNGFIKGLGTGIGAVSAIRTY